MTGHKIAGGVAVAFGLLTLLSGGRALFADVDMGAVVPFVLWFNFVAGAAYVAGGVLIWCGHRLALPVALAIAAATGAVFLAFGVQVATGRAFEMRTVAAMTLRFGFWVAMAYVATRMHAAGSAD